MHRRARQSGHAGAVCALSDARGVCRRRARGRRAICPLLRLLPGEGAGHRPVRAQARRGIRRPRARHDGGPHFPARRRPQDGQPHSRRRVPQARRGRGHALHPALEPHGACRRTERPRQDRDRAAQDPAAGGIVRLLPPARAARPRRDQCCVRHVCQTAEEAGT